MVNTRLTKKLVLLLTIFFILNLSIVPSFSATPTNSSKISPILQCRLYDSFSEGTLNTTNWEIRQDIEGQPPLDEYWVDNSSQNYHMQQNALADRRTYLVPKRNFTTGDMITYTTNLLSRQGTYAQMTLLTGDQYYRMGLRGTYAGFDELGISKVRIFFQENNLHIWRQTPSGDILIDDLPLTKLNGNYELYIGGFSGHDGNFHMDFDNFIICN